MDPITRLLHARIRSDDNAKSAVTPLYQCSGFSAGSPYFYTRNDNPNIAEVEDAIRVLEGSQHCLAVTTGMTAISLVLNLLRPGDTFVVNKDIYGCSLKLFQRISSQRNIGLEILDLSQEENIKQIPGRTRMVIFETPTNPFLKTINIRRVSDRVKTLNPEALVVVDNTWATPLFQQPLKHGADISLHSATKFLSGHSDVMGGVLLTERSELHKELRESRFYGGAILDPHSAWLLRRSLQTFGLRMAAHKEATLAMHSFLEKCSPVARVYYPDIDGKQLLGYGGILFVQLRDDLADRYPEFMNALRLFDTGTAMACVTSMVAQPYTGSHASLTEAEKSCMGLKPSLVRLCFGQENVEDLKSDLAQAFAVLESGISHNKA
ncbi:MAG: PLP-dependent aspartate aminotransferase family protein [Nitrospirota bacterium]